MMRAVALLALLTATNAQPLPVCSGDFHGDGDVDVADVLTVLESFQVNADGDTDGNGVTDTVDLLNVLSQFGESCRATTGGSSAHGCTWVPPASRSNTTHCTAAQKDSDGLCRWDCQACPNSWDWHMKCEDGGTARPQTGSTAAVAAIAAAAAAGRLAVGGGRRCRRGSAPAALLPGVPARHSGSG
jgi:hypothetical protein